jgi:energy-converting hydrogenase Eha subunit A
MLTMLIIYIERSHCISELLLEFTRVGCQLLAWLDASWIKTACVISHHNLPSIICRHQEPAHTYHVSQGNPTPVLAATSVVISYRMDAVEMDGVDLEYALAKVR